MKGRVLSSDARRDVSLLPGVEDEDREVIF